MIAMFSIHSSVKKYPRLPYQKMAEVVLGKDYELSLAFIGDAKSQRLNKIYRNKEYIPNVLSFPLQRNIGEIFINPVQARKEAHAHGMSESGFIGFLFIHALLHLKGHDHGATMEKVEARLKNRFNLT